MQRLKPQGDEGAVAVFVAVLMVVLFGMGALAIDVGAMYAERRQLQNGADAAALAVAHGCAKGPVCSGDASGNLAALYAQGNANDGETNIAPPVIGSGAGWGTVGIETSTLNDGSTALPPVFGRVLMGDAYEGATVRANAVAEWGSPSSTRVSQLAIAECEYLLSLPDEELTILRDGSLGCAGSGFRWLSSDCPSQTTRAIIEVSGKTKKSAGDRCANMLLEHIASGSPVLVALYVPDEKRRVRITGFAAFVVTDANVSRRDTDPDPDPDDEDEDEDGDISITGKFPRFYATDIGDVAEVRVPGNLAIVRLID